MVQRKALAKWSVIVTVCAAHSFFWGLTADASIFAMVLGVLTLILVYAFVESHPRYQARRLAAPFFAKALDCGIKTRIFLALYIPISLLLGSFSGAKAIAPLMWPYLMEMYVGMGAMSVVKWVTGVDGFNLRKLTSIIAYGDQFFYTYLTTIVTGVMHSVVLLIICLCAYGFIRLRAEQKV